MRKALVIVLTVWVAVFWLCPSASASDQTQSLTLEKAVDMALSYSPALKAKELSLEQAEYEREAAATAVTYTPTGQADAETEKAFNNLVQKDLNWQVAKKGVRIPERFGGYPGIPGVFQRASSPSSPL